jgi:hypothetical protein
MESGRGVRAGLMHGGEDCCVQASPWLWSFSENSYNELCYLQVFSVFWGAACWSQTENGFLFSSGETQLRGETLWVGCSLHTWLVSGLWCCVLLCMGALVPQCTCRDQKTVLKVSLEVQDWAKDFRVATQNLLPTEPSCRCFPILLNGSHTHNLIWPGLRSLCYHL